MSSGGLESFVRQYRHEVTDETIAVLRLLRERWAGIRVEPSQVTIRLGDAREISLEVEGADPEPGFEAFRLSAASSSNEAEHVHHLARGRPPFRAAPDFAVGRNDVVLFAGATWIEGTDAQSGESVSSRISGPSMRPLLGRNPIFQFSGHPGQIPESAAAVCITTDAVVIATPVGTGFLIRTGLQPYMLEATDDPVTLDGFLRERGYGALGARRG